MNNTLANGFVVAAPLEMILLVTLALCVTLTNPTVAEEETPLLVLDEHLLVLLTGLVILVPFVTRPPTVLVRFVVELSKLRGPVPFKKFVSLSYNYKTSIILIETIQLLL